MSEEEPGGAVEEVAAAVEEVVPPVDVVHGLSSLGLGMFDESAEIIAILLSLDKCQSENEILYR